MEERFARVSDALDFWAQRKGKETALIEFATGESVDWKQFALSTKAFAAKLLSMGLKKGDVVATSLPMIKEHLYLIYGCYRIGVLVAPLDLRLKTEEVDRYFEKIQPKAYFFLGKTPVMDFRPMISAVKAKHPECLHWIQ